MSLQAESAVAVASFARWRASAGRSMTSTARHECFSEHTTRLNPRASGAAVPQVPYLSSAPSWSSTPFSFAGRVSSLPSRCGATTSQRYQFAPASAASRDGLNQTTSNRLSRCAVWSPPTNAPALSGQASAICLRTARESMARRCPSTTSESSPTFTVTEVCGRLHGTGLPESTGSVASLMDSWWQLPTLGAAGGGGAELTATLGLFSAELSGSSDEAQPGHEPQDDDEEAGCGAL